jgi:hypothetical protein
MKVHAKIKFWHDGAERSAIDLAEDDVDGPDDGDGIRQHMSLGHGVHRLEVGEAGAPDLAAVGLIGVGSGYMRKVVTRVQNDENPLYNSALAPLPQTYRAFHDCRAVDGSQSCPEMVPPVVVNES